jgi:hypothetical protein
MKLSISFLFVVVLVALTFQGFTASARTLEIELVTESAAEQCLNIIHQGKNGAVRLESHPKDFLDLLESYRIHQTDRLEELYFQIPSTFVPNRGIIPPETKKLLSEIFQVRDRVPAFLYENAVARAAVKLERIRKTLTDQVQFRPNRISISPSLAKVILSSLYRYRISIRLRQYLELT